MPRLGALSCHSDDRATLLQEHVKREKAVMAEMQCEFVVALVAAFQDDHHLYLLQEAVMGGEFFTYMQVRFETVLQAPDWLLQLSTLSTHG